MSDITCHTHGVTVPNVTQTEADRLGIEMGCPQHNAELRGRPDPSTMTRQARADELRTLLDSSLWTGFGLTMERIDALVGRSVLTHELIDADLLCHEILTGIVPTIEGIVAKMPEGVPVIVVDGGQP